MTASVLAAGVVSPAWAARPGGGGGGGGSSSAPSGNDVSYPQCGSTLPSLPAFAIVGVNGGLANDLNSCLGPSSSYPEYTQSELYWATASATGTGITTQPKVGLYVNTADPGNEYNGTPISDWPTSSLKSDAAGTCYETTIVTSSGAIIQAGQNSPGCAWQYGYNMASKDMTWLLNAANAINTQETSTTISTSFSLYSWWLDVETANSWQSGSSGQAMNAADLLGMYDALTSASSATKVGIYSTSSQWSSITGNDFSQALPDWIPGARTQSGAVSNCSLAPFSGGPVAITQWTSHSLDSDYAC